MKRSINVSVVGGKGWRQRYARARKAVAGIRGVVEVTGVAETVFKATVEVDNAADYANVIAKVAGAPDVYRWTYTSARDPNGKRVDDYLKSRHGIDTRSMRGRTLEYLMGGPGTAPGPRRRATP